MSVATAISNFSFQREFPNFEQIFTATKPLIKSPSDLEELRIYLKKGNYFGSSEPFTKWLTNKQNPTWQLTILKTYFSLNLQKPLVILSHLKTTNYDYTNPEIQQAISDFLTYDSVGIRLYKLTRNHLVLYRFLIDKLTIPLVYFIVCPSNFSSDSELSMLYSLLKKSKVKVTNQIKDPGFTRLALKNPDAEFSKKINDELLLENITWGGGIKYNIKINRFSKPSLIKNFPMLEYFNEDFNTEYSFDDLLYFNEKLDLKETRLKQFCKKNTGFNPKNVLDLFKKSRGLDLIEGANLLKNVFLDKPSYAHTLLPIFKHYHIDILRSLHRNLETFKKIYSTDQLFLALKNTLESKTSYRSLDFYEHDSYLDDCAKMIENAFVSDFNLNIRSFNTINNFKKLHDFLSSIGQKLKQQNFPLNIKDQRPVLSKMDGFELENTKRIIKIPTDSHELIDWGQSLSNCVGSAGYASSARQGNTIIMGLMYQGEIEFCIEIRHGQVVQFEGKYRTQNQTVKAEFIKTCQKFKLI